MISVSIFVLRSSFCFFSPFASWDSGYNSSILLWRASYSLHFSSNFGLAILIDFAALLSSTVLLLSWLILFYPHLICFIFIFVKPKWRPLLIVWNLQCSKFMMMNSVRVLQLLSLLVFLFHDLLFHHEYHRYFLFVFLPYKDSYNFLLYLFITLLKWLLWFQK